MQTIGANELAFIAQKLSGLRERFAFVGGCVLPLLLDAAYRPTARSTFDVDVVVVTGHFKTSHSWAVQNQPLFLCD